MGEIVNDLIERYELEQFWKQAHDAVERLRADPVTWKDYRDEALMLQGDRWTAWKTNHPITLPKKRRRSLPSMHEPRAGEVWDVLFDPQVGREQRGLRPALVISNDEFNGLRNELHIVVPITGSDRGLPFHVRIEASTAGLTKTSYLMYDQEKAQSIDRFVRKRGQVSGDVLRQAQKIVGRFIDAYRIFGDGA